MSKPLYEPVGKASRTGPRPQTARRPDAMPAELRRVTLANLMVIKRWFPNDWGRLLREADEARTA